MNQKGTNTTRLLVLTGGAILTLAVLVLYHSLTWGIVMYKTYNWFILPLSTNLPDLTFVQCIGIILFVMSFQLRPPQTKIKDEYVHTNSQSTRITTVIVSPWIYLLITYIMKIIIFD